MKKIFFLALIIAFGLSSMSFAAMKVGVYGSIGTSGWWTCPAFVITPGNLKDVNYDVILGYSSHGEGEKTDANVDTLVGGTWWIGQSGPIYYGPTLACYSVGQVGYGSRDKLSENTVTATAVVWSMKTQLIPQLDVRADILVYSSVGGQLAADGVNDSNRILDVIQIGLQYNFPM